MLGCSFGNSVGLSLGRRRDWRRLGQSEFECLLRENIGLFLERENLNLLRRQIGL